MKQSNFAKRLSEAMELRNMKAVHICNISEELYKEGKIFKPIYKGTLSAYLNGLYEAKSDNIYALALILNISEAWLMGLDVPIKRMSDEERAKQNSLNTSNVAPLPDKPTPLPVLGKISAGLPLLASQDIIGYDYAPSSCLKIGHEYFYLVVNGDSMNLKFKDGDRLLIKKQECLENGEIGVIMVNGDDATVKRFRTENDIVILEPMSSNPEHHVQMYNLKNTPIKIIGKVILSISNVN